MTERQRGEGGKFVASKAPAQEPDTIDAAELAEFRAWQNSQKGNAEETEKAEANEAPEADAEDTGRRAKTIRNLTNALVHLRLHGADMEKPYRIELAQRGRRGDWATVPAKLTASGTFISGADRLFEIIPLSEARAIQYGPRPGSSDQPVTVVRHDEHIVSRRANWDGQGKAPAQERGGGAGPQLVDALGADADVHANIRAGESALPDGAFPTKVTTERVREG